MITWLSSYPKSGNTWVRLLLNAYFSGGHVDINKMPWGAGDNRKYIYQTVSPIQFDELTREDMIMLRPAALMHLIKSVSQIPLLVKTHHAYGQINDIHLFPKVLSKRAFYILRDPREIAPSFADHLGWDIDKTIEHMASDDFTISDSPQEFHIVSSWSKHVSSWLKSEDAPIHVIKYSTLKKDPGSVLANILDRIGFERIDRVLIDKCVDATSLSNLSSQEQKNGFDEGRNDKPFFGGKRQELTDSQRLQIESDHGEVMNAAL